MEYVLNKPLQNNRKLGLYASGGICHVFHDKLEELQNCSYNGVLKCGCYCEECQIDLKAMQRCECEKAGFYELLEEE